MVVTSDVRSFGDENTAEAAFDALYEAIGECTHFENTSEDGLETTVIDVAIDTDTATEDVDDQFDMTGGGAWTFDGQEIPLGVGFSIARIDNNITMVMLAQHRCPRGQRAARALHRDRRRPAGRGHGRRDPGGRRRSPARRRAAGPGCRSSPCPARSRTSTPPRRGSSATTDQGQTSMILTVGSTRRRTSPCVVLGTRRTVNRVHVGHEVLPGVGVGEDPHRGRDVARHRVRLLRFHGRARIRYQLIGQAHRDLDGHPNHTAARPTYAMSRGRSRSPRSPSPGPAAAADVLLLKSPKE